MTRDEIYSEMKQMLGTVPIAFQNIPDQFLEQDWQLWKTVLTTDTAIPRKWKALIALGMTSALEDPYGIEYWTDIARANGVSDEELKETAYMARLILGFGPYMMANQVPLDQFKEETMEVADRVRREQAA